VLRRVVLLLSLCLIIISAKEIRVATAANVSYAMAELKEIFEASHKETKVNIILGSSGKLTAQIVHGAPYDIFLSANMKYPLKLYDEGKALVKPIIYAKGSLVIFTTKDDIDLSKGINIVKDVKKIALANYKVAPYGKASVEAIKNAGLYDEVNSKFVNAESITQTLQYTMSATDIGFIAKSSIFSDKLTKFNVKGKYWVDVDSSLYKPIEQGVALLNEEALEFYNFLFSKEAKEVFIKYGYFVNE
jgi:molybdate transport system substrate-binding protein